ncbi:hypothetical protein PV326_004696 [Microctonus aethiopoides]|nr:hypothetical protein PV326_004696 [Microctonus aethiopoides]
MWQSGGMGAHAANNPWMKLMGIVHKERRHHDSGGGASGGQGTTAAGANERGLTHFYKWFNSIPKFGYTEEWTKAKEKKMLQRSFQINFLNGLQYESGTRISVNKE